MNGNWKLVMSFLMFMNDISCSLLAIAVPTLQTRLHCYLIYQGDAIQHNNTLQNDSE
jgi:hypothetical protein